MRLGRTKEKLRAGDYNFFKENEMKIINWEQEFCTHRKVSAVKRAEFVNDRMSYIILRGRVCNIIILNMNAAREDKSDEELEQFFLSFS
jgi:hypothetical protein